jgi:hypothetical protein
MRGPSPQRPRLLYARRVRRLVVIALALAAAGCGGDGGADYGETLETYEPPLAEALDAAVEPCQAQDLPECERLLTDADAAAEELEDALGDAEAPEEVAAEDDRLRSGLQDLSDALQHQIEVAAAGVDDELPAGFRELHDATATINNALGKIADVLDLDLPTI